MENKGKKQKIQGSLADFFELPRDIVLDLPRITLIGSRQLYLENHKGIVEYSDERIKVRVSGGVFLIGGEELTIRNLYASELYVEGEILFTEFIR